MKKLITLITIVLGIITSAGAQIIRVESGTNTKDMYQFAATGGYLSPINGSSFTGGFVKKYYTDGAKRTGFRLDVQIPLGEYFHFRSQADGFLKPSPDARATFLELSAGLGVNAGGFYLDAMYQMNDYNPKTLVDREDQPLFIFGYAFKF